MNAFHISHRFQLIRILQNSNHIAIATRNIKKKFQNYAKLCVNIKSRCNIVTYEIPKSICTSYIYKFSNRTRNAAILAAVTFSFQKKIHFNFSSQFFNQTFYLSYSTSQNHLICNRVWSFGTSLLTHQVTTDAPTSMKGQQKTGIIWKYKFTNHVMIIIKKSQHNRVKREKWNWTFDSIESIAYLYFYTETIFQLFPRTSNPFFTQYSLSNTLNIIEAMPRVELNFSKF